MTLQFSRDKITFDYISGSNLITTITMKNLSVTPFYYKFKVNRPRFYLVKPDRGVIRPNEVKEVTVKLHKQGIPESNSDKFKCFYVVCTPDTTDQQMEKFQERLQYEQRKILVHVNNIPSQIEITRQVYNSELKSLANTAMVSSHTNRMLGAPTTTYESLISERKQRIKQLNEQIQSIKRFNRDRKIAEGPTPVKKKSFLLPLLLTPILGLAIGIVSSLWI